jgi:hypothetical protein
MVVGGNGGVDEGLLTRSERAKRRYSFNLSKRRAAQQSGGDLQLLIITCEEKMRKSKREPGLKRNTLRLPVVLHTQCTMSPFHFSKVRKVLLTAVLPFVEASFLAGPVEEYHSEECEAENV